MGRKVKGTLEGTARLSGAIITPEQLAAGGSEHSHQCALFQWIAIEGAGLLPSLHLLFAVPNGGDRRASVGAAMKAEGVKKGVPDLMLPVAAGRYYGLWIEMKKPGEERKKDGGASGEQLLWHRRLVGQGYAVCLCYSWEAARWALWDYLLGEAGGMVMPLEGGARVIVAPPVVG